MQHLGRFTRWALAIFAATLAQWLIWQFLDAQKKAGHDIGWLGHFMMSTAPFWIIAIAAIIGLIYVFWPSISKRSSGPPATLTPPPATTPLLKITHDIPTLNELAAAEKHPSPPTVERVEPPRAPAVRAEPDPAPSAERKWLTVAPKELTRLYKDNTAVQADELVKPYIGQWVRVSGKVASVKTNHLFGGREVEFEHDWTDPTIPFYVMLFDEKWAESLRIKRPGDLIHVRGKINSVASTLIWLKQCELEQS